MLGAQSCAFIGEFESVLVEAQEGAVRFFFFQRLIEPRAFESLLVLRIRNVFSNRRPRIPPAAHAGPLRPDRIAMAGEILKGRRFAVLFAHEEHGTNGESKRYAGRKLLRFETYQCAESFAAARLPTWS